MLQDTKHLKRNVKQTADVNFLCAFLSFSTMNVYYRADKTQLQAQSGKQLSFSAAGIVELFIPTKSQRRAARGLFFSLPVSTKLENNSTRSLQVLPGFCMKHRTPHFKSLTSACLILTWWSDRTRKAPPPAHSVMTARKRGLTAQKLLSWTLRVIGTPS